MWAFLLEVFCLGLCEVSFLYHVPRIDSSTLYIAARASTIAPCAQANASLITQVARGSQRKPLPVRQITFADTALSSLRLVSFQHVSACAQTGVPSAFITYTCLCSACMFTAHTHTHRHAHTRTHTLSHTRTHSLSHTLSHTHTEIADDCVTVGFDLCDVVRIPLA